MEGMTYLAIGYFGMLVGIALWTYTVVARSQRLEARLQALEEALPSGDETATDKKTDE